MVSARPGTMLIAEPAVHTPEIERVAGALTYHAPRLRPVLCSVAALLNVSICGGRPSVPRQGFILRMRVPCFLS